MLNVIWVAMIFCALICGALTGRLDAVAKASTESAQQAVTLAIGLIGVMAFWLGMMRILQEAGLLRVMARGLGPVMRLLFPSVPAAHPAMSMMILNMVSNLLGLANAATPFGIKAMMELDKLNRDKGTATNAMAMFLAINTSNIAILPTGVIALRASLGSTSPGSIFLPTLLATTCSTLAAISAALLFQRLPFFARGEQPRESRAAVADGSGAAAGGDAQAKGPDTSEAEALINREGKRASLLGTIVAWVLAAALAVALGIALYLESGRVVAGEEVGIAGALKNAVSSWPLLLLLAGIVLYGLLRGVRVYDAVVEGGKEGFQVALRIIPFLVAILVAVGMLRASGALDGAVTALDPFTSLIGMPGETLPMALLRPLSGSGAYAVAAETMKVHGTDSLVGHIVCTMQGSTETTFYVLAVYFGAIGVRNVRHTVAACLVPDVVGPLASVWACRLLLT